jgi:hypothetical protein
VRRQLDLTQLALANRFVEVVVADALDAPMLR